VLLLKKKSTNLIFLNIANAYQSLSCVSKVCSLKSSTTTHTATTQNSENPRQTWDSNPRTKAQQSDALTSKPSTDHEQFSQAIKDYSS